jgi:hypothetical protein
MKTLIVILVLLFSGSVFSKTVYHLSCHIKSSEKQIVSWEILDEKIDIEKFNYEIEIDDQYLHILEIGSYAPTLSFTFFPHESDTYLYAKIDQVYDLEKRPDTGEITFNRFTGEAKRTLYFEDGSESIKYLDCKKFKTVF